MKFLEPLMYWPPLHLDCICNPPSSHRWKLGLTNHSKKIVITRFLRKSSLLIALTLVFSHSP
ncbi:hypothetical protein [Haladaptatus sp. DYF46]|uniref:hypothetical protein n=1 Tax=Haladaptatus sp. DYF46 TaxID=2886041 RepID=UPI001E35C900|nr:hypothetical protein [Haladaptatus sp. DYF46]